MKGDGKDMILLNTIKGGGQLPLKGELQVRRETRPKNEKIKKIESTVENNEKSKEGLRGRDRSPKKI